MGTYRTARLNLIKEYKVCEMCKTLKAIYVHHIDHDRTNNDVSNFMFLCRGCHLIIHKKRTKKRLSKQECKTLGKRLFQ